MSSHGQKVPEAIPSQSFPPIRHQTRELPEISNITQHVHVAVAARHGVTASRFPWPHIGGSREKKTRLFFSLSSASSFPPRLPAVLCLSILSLSGGLSFVGPVVLSYTASPESFDPARFLGIREQAQSHWPRRQWQGLCHRRSPHWSSRNVSKRTPSIMLGCLWQDFSMMGRALKA